MMRSISIPIRLTLVRLILSPLLVPVLFAYLLPYDSILINGLLGCLFLLLSVTDFFDGYLARKYNQESLLGKVLDPLADKFLNYCALVGLLAAGKIYFYWVIVLIGREFFVMGLRHVALEYRFSIPVSRLSKLKTALQMICLSVIIINPYQRLGVHSLYWNGIETGLLLLTIVLSLLTAEQYYDEFMTRMPAYAEHQSIEEFSHDESIS